MFIEYLKMGFEHISDIRGYDHMLFIIVLCSIYRIAEWKKVAVLVTAFTLGHSTTLALSALKIVLPNAKWIEVLIPVTIACTSIANLLGRPAEQDKGLWVNYTMALLFGFIHGLGFSNFFNALMGDSMDIVFPLFAFNLGLELGQLLIVTMFFGIYALISNWYKFGQRDWVLFFSGAGAGISVIMIIERI